MFVPGVVFAAVIPLAVGSKTISVVPAREFLSANKTHSWNRSFGENVFIHH